ncbi:OmpH/Skp family outer membrane protein [Puniceicoccus vermicola]|uniref:OmpH family outer membrane protein n=1 Tax=Puniceicoccus vermicola TaxID=388746 RepID=A0A7X1AY31_9BACT|nr:OmpH family outer membrane protein [Puniceicoccus vermicola]MBC2601899.1 OmpH family outer membrane protein [Puniceicoccus vermicola]
MIKKHILLLTALVAGSLTLSAQEATKVGVVDLDLVLQQYDQFNDAKAKLKEQQERADAELRPMVDSINSLRQEIQTVNDRINNPTSSEESQMEARNQARQLQAELEQKAIEFQRLRAEAQRTIGQREQNMLSMVLDDVRGATATVAEEMGLDLVLSNQNQIVLYFGDSLEISDEVLAQLSEASE